jgi:hypothetical protein
MVFFISTYCLTSAILLHVEVSANECSVNSVICLYLGGETRSIVEAPQIVKFDL